MDRLLLGVTPNPPHKQSQVIAPLPLRLEMAQAAIQNNPSFELSRVDIDRQPPHYALDTCSFFMSSTRGRKSFTLLAATHSRTCPPGTAVKISWQLAMGLA